MGIENIYPFPTFQDFIGNIHKLGLHKYVKCFTMCSEEFLKAHPEHLQSIDTAFLDGEHSYNQVKLEFKTINNTLSEKLRQYIIMLHDSHMTGPYLVIKNATINQGFDLLVVGVTAVLKKSQKKEPSALTLAYLLMLDHANRMISPAIKEIFGII